MKVVFCEYFQRLSKTSIAIMQTEFLFMVWSYRQRRRRLYSAQHDTTIANCQPVVRIVMTCVNDHDGK